MDCLTELEVQVEHLLKVFFVYKINNNEVQIKWHCLIPLKLKCIKCKNGNYLLFYKIGWRSYKITSPKFKIWNLFSKFKEIEN